MYFVKPAYKILIGLYVFLLFTPEKLNAQIIISAPGVGGFSQACASETFNTYNTTFVFTPEEALTASNQFSIELSDADGFFINSSEIIYTSEPGEITTSPATIQFSIPVTTAGENYRIRIKSSSPEVTSAGSSTFAAYYKIQDSPFTINNLVSTAVYCAGGSYLLTIDDPGTGSNDSPLNYPSLTFNWFKETGPTTSVFIEETTALLVTEPGTYFVETNYGTCTSNSFSNRVTISGVSSGEADAGISSSLGNPFCPGSGSTTLTTISGLSYQWFRDGVMIMDATDQMYDANMSGVYVVQVDLGDCSASGSIDLISQLFEASINVPESNMIEEDETLSIEVTSNAVAPTYEWFLNDSLIVGANEDNYETNNIGSYKVVITENSGCIASQEFLFEIEEAFDAFPEVEKIPNVVSPNGDGINDTWTIPLQYVSGSNSEVIIMSNNGKIVLQTNDYLNNWPETNLSLSSINQVFYYIITTADNTVKKGSITLVK